MEPQLSHWHAGTTPYVPFIASVVMVVETQALIVLSGESTFCSKNHLGSSLSCASCWLCGFG